jgi:cell wall-associated NlpC family hydrolase
MTFDPRLTPARPDLAAARLRGEFEADRYAEGVRMQVTEPVLDLTSLPDPETGLATQLLFGEIFTVYETRTDGLAWGQAEADGYVGYVAVSGLTAEVAQPNARVVVPATHIYPKPSMKTRPLGWLPLHASVVGVRNGEFVELAQGRFCPAQHVAGMERLTDDPVCVSEQFLGTPYLWGGKSWRGIDCSGLVQVSLTAAGINCPRDSDMQESLGDEIAADAPLRRGDLIFWKGHVGVMQNAEQLLHANAHWMRVTSEPLSVVEERVRNGGYGEITARRRV